MKVSKIDSTIVQTVSSNFNLRSSKPMNSCILMALIVSDPELRTTQDQMTVSSMIVEFEPSKEGEEPGKVQVEGWGNLAEEMKNNYSAGDQIIIEGRLSMNVFERQEGYKEKRAKLVASRIYPLSGGNFNSANFTSNTPSYQSVDPSPSNVVDFTPSPQKQATPSYAPKVEVEEETPKPVAPSTGGGNEDWDEIPF
jgi:single-strand DNA-binding protein